MTTTVLPARPNLRPVLWTAPLAGVLAAAVNVALFLLTRSLFDGVLVGPQQMSITAGAVVVTSLVGALGAGVVYALLARSGRARLFPGVALAFLLLSLAGPLTAAGVPLAVKLTLCAMHVVTYAAVMLLVPRRRA
ncbi:DUF6069 family protein [Deinococcus pimensis]|uniref:DUF6069 family protein n=1 Tax=Deinococcus pimensis TaxID=309888 RepID=UPI0004AE421E|nr:DUF6069 family protein [Deinococcus pimensis]